MLILIIPIIALMALIGWNSIYNHNDIYQVSESILKSVAHSLKQLRSSDELHSRLIADLETQIANLKKQIEEFNEDLAIEKIRAGAALEMARENRDRFGKLESKKLKKITKK